MSWPGFRSVVPQSTATYAVTTTPMYRYVDVRTQNIVARVTVTR